MASDQKKILPIDYTSRDFDSIRDDLMGIAERFYPNTFQDFSEASFGSLMLDAVAYVGDQLSFYMDYNVNESFLDTAYQYGNVVRQGRILGYKDRGRPSTYGEVAFFVLVPASQVGMGPDANYTPILKRGSQISSVDGLSFVLTANVDFADPTNSTVVARVDDATGAPTWYAIKAYGNVVSGQFSIQESTIGQFERFKRVGITDPNLTEIISVVDTEGNEYFEVDYLAQDIVYKEMSNKNFKNDNVPSILKPYLVSRKFTVERTSTNTYLQFGSGKSGETNVIANPQSVALDIFGKDYVTDTTFDPSRLTKNENFGLVPYNTTLTILYRATNPLNSNAAAGAVREVTSGRFEFADETVLVAETRVSVVNSLEVMNETPIMGDVDRPTTSEIKRRIYDTFPTQNRAVTQADYENVAYRMPAKFGSILRCSAQKDPSALKRNVNLYVISQDPQGKLAKTNATIKTNLKTWLDNYRMINDTIDILDPYIINIGINFVIRIKVGAEKYTVLDEAVDKIAEMYNAPFFIGEPLYISDIYSSLKDVSGVLDVEKVMITNKTGANYSAVEFDINKNMAPDGGYIVVPKNAILELKYPEADVKGKVK